MDALGRLQRLGYRKIDIERVTRPMVPDIVSARVYTEKNGWIYGKFEPGDDAAIETWAAKHNPE